jgi:WD40 repeat protein/serine/threonine protein kinase
MANVEHGADRSRDDRLADVIERYLTASESGDPPSRTALLDQHPDLADDLAACFETLDFIGHSLGQAPATAVLECGQQFGEYQILREIGRGGMGVVYEAFHLGLERRVALKVLSGRSFEDERQRERFLLEAKTAAGLHHTNIVPIFEVGELDGVCYYAMQFIRGQSLGSIVRSLRNRRRQAEPTDTTVFPPGTIVRDERAAAMERRDVPSEETPASSPGVAGATTTAGDRATPSTSATQPMPAAQSSTRYHLAEGPVSDGYFREVAGVIAQAADALSHAHAHNVVHRDVKPSNLILDGEGRVWVADFGLAFRSNAPAERGAGDAVGTPAYMSPEQVRTGEAPVNERTDIYSLGATLYELLTLRPIFEGNTSLSVLTQIATVEPSPPRQVNPRVPKDLDSIVRKATAKRIEDRYHDAAGLASDLRRYLHFEPIRARNVGPFERLALWCRREPKLAGVTTAAAALLVLVSIVSHWLILGAHSRAVEARDLAQRQRDRATNAEAEAQGNLWDALFQQARATRLSFQTGRRWAALDLIAKAQAIPSDRVRPPDATLDLRDEAIAALAIDDARLHKQIAVDDQIDFVAFAETGNRLICGTHNGSLQLVDLDSQSAPIVLAAGDPDEQPMWFGPSIATSPCGQFVARGSRDGSIDLWDLNSRVQLGGLVPAETRPRPIFLIFLAEPTRLLAVDNNGMSRQWQIAQDVRELPSREFGRLQSITRGPDAQSVSILTATGEVEIWDVASGERRPLAESLSFRPRTTSGMAWNYAGKLLAVGRRSGSVDLFEPGESNSTHSLGGHRGFVWTMAFNTQNSMLAASGAYDTAVRVWDVRTGLQIASLNEPRSSARSVSFSPDGRFVASGGSDKTIWVWELVSPKSTRRLAGHDTAVTRVAITPDGQRLLSGADDGSILVWDLTTAAEPQTLIAKSSEPDSGFNDRACSSLTISSDGRLVAVRSRNGAVSVRELDTGTEIASRRGRGPGGGSSEFLPDSREILRSVDREIQRWPVDGEQTPVTIATTKFPVRAMTLSRDGRRVAASTWGNRIELFDIATGSRPCEPIELLTSVWAVALSPDGSLLAAGDARGDVQLIDSTTGTQRATWHESKDQIATLTFSPNGESLAVASRDGSVRLRSVATGATVARLPGHVGGVNSLVFAPDGDTLATCGADKLVHLWRLDVLRSELASIDLAW